MAIPTLNRRGRDGPSRKGRQVHQAAVAQAAPALPRRAAGLGGTGAVARRTRDLLCRKLALYGRAMGLSLASVAETGAPPHLSRRRPRQAAGTQRLLVHGPRQRQDRLGRGISAVPSGGA